MRYLLKESKGKKIYFYLDGNSNKGYIIDVLDPDNYPKEFHNVVIKNIPLKLFCYLLVNASGFRKAKSIDEIRAFLGLSSNDRNNVYRKINELRNKINDCIWNLTHEKNQDGYRIVCEDDQKGYYISKEVHAVDEEGNLIEEEGTPIENNKDKSRIDSFYQYVDKIYDLVFNLKASFYQSASNPEDIENILNTIQRQSRLFIESYSSDKPLYPDIQKAIQRIELIDEKIETLKSAFLGSAISAESRNAYLSINQNFINQCCINSSDFEEEKLKFYNYTHSPKTTIKMLVNKLLIETDEYIDICRDIYKTAMSSMSTFLMADGGLGKSTMLCAVALMAFYDGVDVFYCDTAILDNLPTIRNKTLILVDNLYDNTEVFKKLCHRYQEDSRVHVLLAERVYKMSSLKEELEREEYINWINKGKGIYLKRSENAPAVSFLKRNTEDLLVSDGLIKTISDEIIRYRIKNESLNSDVQISISYSNRTITDSVLDYFVEYNRITEDDSVGIKPYTWDWDIWNEDPNLQGLFKYIAALHGCGVKVSTYCFEKMTGRIAALSKAILERRVPVSIDQYGFIQLRHDSVADNFFAVTGISPYDVLREIIEESRLDEDTVVLFEKKVFSISNIKEPPSELEKYRIPILLDRFNRSEEYRNILIRRKRIHSLEFALILQRSFCVKDKDQFLTKTVGESFVNVVDIYKHKIEIWMKYFFFTVRNQVYLPLDMLEYLMGVPGLYKKITQCITLPLKRFDMWSSDDEKHYLLSNSESFFCWIIDNIDSNDIPSRYALCLIYRNKKEFNNARKIIRELSSIATTDNDKFNCATSIIEIYIEEVKYLKKAFGNKPNQQIKENNKAIMDEYEKWIHYYGETDKYSEYYITFVSGYAGYLIDKGRFDKAYRMLIETKTIFTKANKEQYLFRIYSKLGILCQRPRNWNRYYDLTEAVKWFDKALELIPEKQTKSKLSVLKPLCKTHLVLGNYDTVKELCAQMYHLDSTDREIILLYLESERLQNIRDQGLPIGKGCNEEWLKKASTIEIESSILEISETMTEAQRDYAETIGLLNQQKTPVATKDMYRTIYCVSQNLAIPYFLLRKCKLDWNRQNSIASILGLK